MENKFEFTTHAIERYCKRVEPGLSYSQGLERLRELRSVARRWENTEDGQHMWMIENPRCAFVTKNVWDNTQRCHINLVVTVLGEREIDNDTGGKNWEDYERELLEEYKAELKKKEKEKEKHKIKERQEADKQNSTKIREKAPPSFAEWSHLLAYLTATHRETIRYESHWRTMQADRDHRTDALRYVIAELRSMESLGSPEAGYCLERFKTKFPEFGDEAFSRKYLVNYGGYLVIDQSDDKQ